MNHLTPSSSPSTLSSIAPLPCGTSLQGGAYKVLRVLGQGGFGITYLCRDNQLLREVAVKEFFLTGCLRSETSVLPGPSLSEQDFSLSRSQFLREAQTLARFDDRGIVQVFGVFEENQTVYMVMEYIQGKTLLELIEEQGALCVENALNYIEKASLALDVVHRAQLLHRDIKPGNIMVGQAGRVVILDFGLTGDMEVDGTHSTRRLVPMVVGSAGFAPIEQYGHHSPLLPSTDIYALGATLYYLLTGQIPTSALQRASGMALESPTVFNPLVPAPFAQAVVVAMHQEPDQRPQNVSLFLEELRSAQDVEQETGQSQTTLSPQLMRRFCPQCGDQGVAEAVMCSRCGTWLAEVEVKGAGHVSAPIAGGLEEQPLPEWVQSHIDQGTLTPPEVSNHPPPTDWWHSVEE